MSGPLDNTMVIDFTRVLAGPYCTMILHNLGAEIIKIEKVVTGDDARSFGPFIDNRSAYFASLNYGKKSVALNLKNEDDLEQCKKLIEKADVVVENFRPGTMNKLGLGYNELKIKNPELIYAAISGFGHSGPESQEPAYDMIVQGRGGIMSLTGESDGTPVRVGASIGDITAGIYGAVGIISALFQRNKTGQGQKVDIAMLDCQVSILENAIARYVATGEIPGPLGSRHPSITPFQAFKTKDSWLIIAVGNEKHWEHFCQALNLTHLINSQLFGSNKKRTENQAKLEKIITKKTREYTAEKLLEVLKRHNVPCTKINSIADVLNDPQVIARNMIKDMDSIDGFKVAGNPIKMSKLTENYKAVRPPKIGEHNEEILNKYINSYNSSL